MGPNINLQPKMRTSLGNLNGRYLSKVQLFKKLSLLMP